METVQHLSHSQLSVEECRMVVNKVTINKYKVFRLPKTLFIQVFFFIQVFVFIVQPIASLDNINKHLDK